jgi:PAS domain S-box-containing protein
MPEIETVLRAILEATGSAAVIAEADTTISLANEEFAKLSGYSKEELEGKKSWAEFFRGDFLDNKRLHRIVAGNASKRYESEFINRYDLATSTMVSVSMIPGTDKSILSFLDITGRKHAEEELRGYRGHLEEIVDARTAALQEVNSMLQLEIAERSRITESRGRLVDIIETTPDIVATLDLDGYLTYCNKTGRQMLGRGEQDEITGRKIFDFYPDWAKRIIQEEVVPAAVRNGTWSGETSFKGRDGHEIPVSQVFIVHKRPDGSVSHLSTIARDISETKQVEEQISSLNEDLERRALELSAANKELEAFAHSVSHDLRAPLRRIHGFSQALLEDYADSLDRQGREYLERLYGSSEQVTQLIDDLLDLSRITRSEMRRQRVDLSALAQTIASDLQKTTIERQVEIVIQAGMTVKGDPRLLQVMLANLLDNAWKFTGKQAMSRIEFGSLRARGEHTFFVRDNGAGFDMAYADKLFDPFQRLHSQAEFPGTGIGLATVQRIVHRHGGQIWAEGEVGKGAAFYFTLSKDTRRAPKKCSG